MAISPYELHDVISGIYMNGKGHSIGNMNDNEQFDRAVQYVRDYSKWASDMGKDMTKSLAECQFSEPDEDTREWWDDIMEYLCNIQENSQLLGTAKEMVENLQILNRMKADVKDVLNLIIDELDMMQMGYLCSDAIRDGIFQAVFTLQQSLVKVGVLMK